MRKLNTKSIARLSLCLIALTGFTSLAQDKVGKRFFKTILPNDKSGNPRRTIKAKPLISKRFSGPVPTNDWCSSLVWPTQSQHSLAMFPHPLGVQAHADGLGIGYNPTPSIDHSFKDGKKFQTGTSYKYPHRESMRIGLRNVASESTVLDRCSDWDVTALWKSGDDELKATFAHGSPFVYFERKSEHPIQIKFSAPPINRNAQPVNPLVFEQKNITSKHTNTVGAFVLSINAGKNVGIGSKARLVYDFDGDGKTDRTETFGMFPTDPAESTFEKYSSEKQIVDQGLTQGEMREFANGSIRLEFWKCFGTGAVSLDLTNCKLNLPIKNGELHLTAKGEMVPSSSNGTITLEDRPAPKPASIFFRNKNVLGVTVDNTHYGIFAPTGSNWTEEGKNLTSKSTDHINSTLADRDYMSIAVLPDASEKSLKFYQRFAYAFPIETRVGYQYDEKAARVRTTFSAKTVPKEGENRETIFALYRHQHLHLETRDTLTTYQYASPRGTMKVVTGKEFVTSTPFTGVLPTLPNAKGEEQKLGKLVETFAKDLLSRDRRFQADDTYWNGKEFGKISEVIQIAEQLGKSKIRQQLVNVLKTRIENWADANEKFFFYYDADWNTLIGYPDSYGSADQLNDHHFHYSYFIKAAATIAQFDPEWVKKENYGDFIDLLIRNCSNIERNDPQFPWMRNFDPYAGHSWAAGHAGFASGNNQESSSESMNFAAALILYGEATNNRRIRDMGVYWYATESEAIRNYWFDTDQAVFPGGYGHRCAGMVWSDGATYGTWWTANPEEIHGINFLPLTGASLYLATDPKYIERNFANMLSSNKSFHEIGFEGNPKNIDKWHDVLHEYLAMSDADQAIKRHLKNGDQVGSEFGESKVHTAQWFGAWKSLGHFDSKTTANIPTAAVFINDDVKTYVVHNLGKKSKVVAFSDGVQMRVSPGLNVKKHSIER